MNSDKPFIHLLKSPYNYYFYDVNTDDIVHVSEETHSYLTALLCAREKESVESSSNVEEELISLKEAGYLKTKRPLKIENPQTDGFLHMLSHGLRMLTLQVTQKCNFRCSYCSYSDEEMTRNRKHSAKSMTWATAKKAIDFFCGRIRDTKKVNIGFYGGEPLLEFDLIKQAIEYAEDRLEGKQYSFNMTINGSLLTLETARYFSDKNVSVLISLDGPKEIHDKNRKLAADGSGTFDIIQRNLQVIEEELPEYLSSISYNSVIDPINDYSHAKHYFASSFAQSTVSTPFMDPQVGTSLIYSNEFVAAYKIEQLLGFLHIQGAISQNEMSPLSKQFSSSLKSSIGKFKMRSELPDRIGHGGPCLPGVLRLFIDVDGNMFPCERVSEASDAMKIGHIESGFNYDNALALLNVSNLTEDKCRNCWALTHCNLCAKHADDVKHLSAKAVYEHCRSSKEAVESEILGIIALNETKEVLSKHT